MLSQHYLLDHNPIKTVDSEFPKCYFACKFCLEEYYLLILISSFVVDYLYETKESSINSRS